MNFILLIPLFPFTAFILLAVFGEKIKDFSHRITIPAMALSFIFSVISFFEVLSHGVLQLNLYSFIRSETLVIDIGLYVDQLATLILMLVTGVGTLVHIFSSHYMQGDPRYTRFFAITSLFSFAMLMVIMSTNLLMLYLFWEIMGICSYLLISHWADRKQACDSALRVFLVNAVADVGLGLGVFLSFKTFGTLDIQQILDLAHTKVGQQVNLLGWLGMQWPVEILTLISILFLIGIMGKSAQFPFHVWLPYAMEAPTPISALIHAATLVKAGIFLLIRLGPLFILSPTAMGLVVCIGGITALLGGIIALTQSDIKKILAYSTMSQLGFMVLSCGMGAYIAAVFHLLAHGVVKAFLFLSSGSAIQNLSPAHSPQPKEHRTTASWLTPFSIGILSLACLPPLLIAFSHYNLLWNTASATPSLFFWFIALGTCFLTAIYLSHWMQDIFYQSKSSGLPKGLVSTASIGLLVTLILAGLLNLFWKQFAKFLSPAVAQAVPEISATLNNTFALSFMALALLFVLAGWGLIRYFTLSSAQASPGLAEAYNRLYVLFHNKWYFDEIYDRLIVHPVLRYSKWLWKSVDVQIFERLVMEVGRRTATFSRWMWEAVDIRAITWLVDQMAKSIISLARWMWKSVDIRGLEYILGGLVRQNASAGQGLQKIEPSMLQHQLLVIVFVLVIAMIIFFSLM